MNAHTPGPWRTNGEGVFRDWPGGVVQVAALGGAAFDGAEQAANARLIAAAPDMLAALEECKEVLESEAFKQWDGAAVLTHIRAGTAGYNGKPLPIDAIRAAIAKAEGETA